MLIVGCDYHPGFQQIAYVEERVLPGLQVITELKLATGTETGELQERRLGHHEEAERFYRDLAARGT